MPLSSNVQTQMRTRNKWNDTTIKVGFKKATKSDEVNLTNTLVKYIVCHKRSNPVNKKHPTY